MACRGRRTARRDPQGSGPNGGERWPPSRRFWRRLGATLALAILLAAAVTLTAIIAPQPNHAADSAALPPESATGPYQVMPDPYFLLHSSPADKTPNPTPPGPTPSAPPTAASSVVQPPSQNPAPTPAAIASSVSAPPVPVPPAPAPAPEPAAARLARLAGERFGITIVLDGQDWGPDEPSQQMNIQAVISALERLPQRALSAVAGHPHGALTFLSNRQGRTLDGWQPYGNFPMGFYTNSDQGPAGYRTANEVVLIPGFSDMSIGHEILHAYHFRNVGADQYALALLGDEMRSFMAATGWRQTGTDQQVRDAFNQPWDVLNGLFVYEGRPLTYVSAAGSTVTLTPPNPLEAFAVAGSVYYTHPAGMPLPDWPEYWSWFQQNLG